MNNNICFISDRVIKLLLKTHFMSDLKKGAFQFLHSKSIFLAKQLYLFPNHVKAVQLY